MQQFTHAIVLALNNKNWYAALAVALALPDICGWLENPDEKVGKRYSNWYNKNFKYTLIEKIPEEIRKEFRNEQKSFLTGEDCYSLRCAYLHSGIDDITKKPTKRVNHNDCQKEVN